MKTLSVLVVSFLLGGLLLIASPQRSFAAAAPTPACPEGQVATSFAWGGKKCFDEKNPSDGTNNPVFVALLTIFNFLAVGVGIVVTGGIIFGAITYITSNGNASQAQQGITVIVNSVIGLLLFIFMYAILNYLVPGGLFR